MRCSNCQAELPEDARFCIECGTEVTRASTGATERLPERASGPRCATCGVVSPAGALFCVNCGTALVSGAQRAGMPAVEAERPVIEHYAEDPQLPAAPSAHPPAGRRKQRGFQFRPPTPASGAVFMIGLGVLFLTGFWWPGILVLVGVTGALENLRTGSVREGLVSLVFMCGLAALFYFDIFWPGILILIGVTALIGNKWF